MKKYALDIKLMDVNTIDKHARIKDESMASIEKPEPGTDYLMIRLPRWAVKLAKKKAAMREQTMLSFVSELIEASDPNVNIQ